MELILFLLLLISSSLQIDESKALIIYFSRAGENYSVGTVDKGNTEIIVDYLTKVTKIKSFKINPETEYPTSYSETVEIARNEKNTNSRPNIKNPLTSISDYDVILLGYPIWHGNLPNIVMTQLNHWILKEKQYIHLILMKVQVQEIVLMISKIVHQKPM